MKLLRCVLMLSSLLFFLSKAGAESLKVGGAAPTLSATTDEGTTLNLGDVYKQNNYTLVWFYPKALTGGCTKQGCSLRDLYPKALTGGCTKQGCSLRDASAELKQHGVAVIGVSTDSVEKQKEFKQTNNFPFPLLADSDKKVMKAFGQTGTLGFASREAYLIDRSGKVVYHDEKQTDKQAEMVLAFLNSKKG